ncbi:DNA-binding GntR family transcriptional regulator [Ochrobactrum daejeonense]|uniref:DNA-binding GntR family transcriptional regulator n=1 Tax=Brucella daejeonensis TaxID=659015 RepID=A0A7W9AVB5_9HYPH|nr:GntR family transcriptional regulator [Brucella daejeonensis]MBB5701186.1 DNA-binding GntR family transcriptional regulator [Brucella daejeonensis]NKB79735.1 GntR family transcriptional regulator [Brucella daejeonensis]
MAEQKGVSPQQIVEKVWLSIAERRLRPGMQLKEEQMAAIFNVSRARIRQVLAALKREGLVDIFPNRGAFVCKPTVGEARDVFFVRRTVERCVVERLCRSATQTDFRRLSDHVDRECVANAANSTTDIIKLSGGFHLLLAELAASDFLLTTMRDLVSRTSLITAIYRKADYFNCGPDEHAEIVDAIARKDLVSAAGLMAHHLDHVEGQLDLRDINDFSFDLSAAFAE